MGILLCEPNFRDVWIRNKSVRAEIGQILRTHTQTHTHTTAAKLVVRILQNNCKCIYISCHVYTSVWLQHVLSHQKSELGFKMFIISHIPIACQYEIGTVVVYTIYNNACRIY